MINLITLAAAAALTTQASPVDFTAAADTETRPATASVATAKAPAAVSHDWQDAGQARWVDDLLSGPYGVTASTLLVDVQADAANPGYWRIVNPYGPSHPMYEGFETLLVDDGQPRYITIDARDAKNVIIEPSAIGLKYRDEEYIVASHTWYEKTGELTSDFINNNNFRGTETDGIITFAQSRSLWLTTASLDEAGSGWFTNTSGSFALYLPGSHDYACEILTNAWCCDDSGNVIVSVWGGDDVASVRLQVTRAGQALPTEANWEAAQALTPRQGYYFALPADRQPAEKFYLHARAYDAQGALVNTAEHYAYAADNNLSDWQVMGAKASFTDNILSNVFSDIDLGVYDVEVHQNKANPALFRLANPYHGIDVNMLDGYSHGSHPHYIYLDATDPECVVLRESAIGFTSVNDGDMRVSSRAALMLEDGATMAEVKEAGAGGVMKFNMITFPVTASIYVGFNSEGTKLWFANYETDSWGNQTAGSLKIDLRDAIAAGVTSVAAPESPARYYNLQGIEIAAPSPGQPCIKKAGGKAEKVINY